MNVSNNCNFCNCIFFTPSTILRNWKHVKQTIQNVWNSFIQSDQQYIQHVHFTSIYQFPASTIALPMELQNQICSWK